MKAEYHTTCPCGCNSPITPGMEIASTGSGWVIAGHEKPVEICQRCFMAKSVTGVCDCD